MVGDLPQFYQFSILSTSPAHIAADSIASLSELLQYLFIMFLQTTDTAKMITLYDRMNLTSNCTVIDISNKILNTLFLHYLQPNQTECANKGTVFIFLL